MDAHAAHDITALLAAWQRGEEQAAERLMPLVYPELKKIVAGLQGRREHTQPTGLIHEAYLRLVRQKRVRWQDRKHFFGLATRLIQRILVDQARRRGAQKRGGGARRVPLAEIGDLATERPDLLVELDRALLELERRDPDKASVVRCKFFGGLTAEETAEVLGCSPRTVKRHWRLARAWLYHELSRAE